MSQALSASSNDMALLQSGAPLMTCVLVGAEGEITPSSFCLNVIVRLRFTSATRSEFAQFAEAEGLQAGEQVVMVRASSLLKGK